MRPGETHARLEPVEHHVRVRHRRLSPSLAVAGRPRVGARAARTHHQDVARIHPRDAPAPRTDRVDLGLGGAVRVRTHELLVGERDHEILDETDVGARAAHVAGDEVGEVEPPAEICGRRDAPGRARQHRRDRQPAGALRGRDPTVRGHDEHRAPVAACGDRSLEPGQVTVDEGADVRIESGRVEALVLPELRQHLVRGGGESRPGAVPAGALAAQASACRGASGLLTGTARGDAPQAREAVCSSRFSDDLDSM